ncbi:MAG TPA: DUF6125 family protein [Syntrophomonadaceae bacterium]|nr:DUF6125 family protein [Syntrophomonadaceae bacterium]
MNYNYVPDDMWKELAIDFAKRWLAHDGLWFQAVECCFGIDDAIAVDIAAWKTLTVLEVKRIMSLLKMKPGGGLDALEECLKYRMYAFLNEQEIVRPNEKTLIFRMNKCRVQAALESKGMQFFKCKPVGLVEYGKFAETVDSSIKTRCIGCPPDEVPSAEWHCAWEFVIE